MSMIRNTIAALIITMATFLWSLGIPYHATPSPTDSAVSETSVAPVQNPIDAYFEMLKSGSGAPLSQIEQSNRMKMQADCWKAEAENGYARLLGHVNPDNPDTAARLRAARAAFFTYAESRTATESKIGRTAAFTLVDRPDAVFTSSGTELNRQQARCELYKAEALRLYDRLALLESADPASFFVFEAEAC